MLILSQTFVPERERGERDRESEIERNHKKRLNKIEKVKTE